MNAEAQNPAMTEVRKFLKDADSYDPTLSDQEMLELYQVLQDSQKTATAEDEQRRIFEQTDANCSMIDELRRNSVPVHTQNEDLESIGNEATEKCGDVLCSSSSEEDVNTKKQKPFTPKSWSLKKKQAKPVSDSEDQISSTSAPTKHVQQKQSEEEEVDVDIIDIVDVFNSVPTTHKPLKRISLSPKYSPPFYCTPKIINLDNKQRACLIANCHLELLAKYSNYQRQSVFPAPWGKAVQSVSSFNGSLMRKNERLEETTSSSQENVGVDQLFEAIKEDKSSDEDFQIYVSKSGRQTKRKLYTENVDDNANEWKKRSKPILNDAEDAKKSHPKKRRIGSFSKEETMKRSKLFADTTNSPRTDKIFEKLKEGDLRKKEAEREMEKFSETLQNWSGEDVEDSVNIAELVHSEEPFIRRRVVPPSRAKKAGGAGRNKPTGRSKDKKNTGSKKSSSESSSQEAVAQKYDPLDIISTSKSAGSSKQKAACPVCFEEFFQSELVEHTPLCLDTHNQNSSTTKPLDFCQTRITCEACDEAFPLDMLYEDHVKVCLKAQYTK